MPKRRLYATLIVLGIAMLASIGSPDQRVEAADDGAGGFVWKRALQVRQTMAVFVLRSPRKKGFDGVDIRGSGAADDKWWRLIYMDGNVKEDGTLRAAIDAARGQS